MNPPPLTWTKATFHVPIRPPGESKVVSFPVAGIVAGPFVGSQRFEPLASHEPTGSLTLS